MKTSEFGKGFVYNLMLFVYHMNNDLSEKIGNYAFVMNKSEKERKLILSDNPDSKHSYGFNKDVKWWYEKIVPIYSTPILALSSQITLWANGASDHLYELEIPNTFKSTELGGMIKELKDTWLTIGHGVNNKIYTYDDYLKCWEDVRKIAILIDKKFGIDDIKGEYE